MLDTTLAPKEAVYLLADHLDAALAAGEDLLASRLAAMADLDTTENGAQVSLAQFVARLERLEASFMGRVLQARRRLDELPLHDVELRPVSNLFFSSTGLFLELISQAIKQSENQFDVGGDRLPFLRDRGLLARDAAGLPQYAPVVVSETYRIGGILELGPLMDMVAGLLDLLDRRYDLYADAEMSDAAIDDHVTQGRQIGAEGATMAGYSHPNTLANDAEAGAHDSGAARTVDQRTNAGARSSASLPAKAPFDAAAVTPASLMEALREFEQPNSEATTTAPTLQ